MGRSRLSYYKKYIFCDIQTALLKVLLRLHTEAFLAFLGDDNGEGLGDGVWLGDWLGDLSLPPSLPAHEFLIAVPPLIPK